VSAADWIAVAIIHHVNVPSDIRTALESAGIKVPTFKASSQGSPKSATATVTPAKPSASPRAAPIVIPTKGKAGSGGSPQQMASSLTPVRETPRSGIHASPKLAASDEPHGREREREGPKMASPKLLSADGGSLSRRSGEHASPSRRHAEIEGSVSRRGASQRASVTALAAAMGGAGIADDPRPALARRSSTAGTGPRQHAPSPPRSTESGVHAHAQAPAPAPVRPRRRSTSLEDMPTPVLPAVKTAVPAAKSLNSASSNSSTSSGGSLSDNTITSEGFTDYLSDESDAEIQRQAERQAALVAQNHAEEAEFDLARKRLQKVNLRPPATWNSTVRASGAAHAPLSSYNYNSPKQVPGYAV
jgi:hypothetical protein